MTDSSTPNSMLDDLKLMANALEMWERWLEANEDDSSDPMTRWGDAITAQKKAEDARIRWVLQLRKEQLLRGEIVLPR